MKPEPPPKLPTKPHVAFDWRDWAHLLDEPEATEAQQKELIETLWAIVLGFIDLGFEVGTAAEEAEICGQDLDLTAALYAAVLYSEEKEQE